MSFYGQAQQNGIAGNGDNGPGDVSDVLISTGRLTKT